MRLMNDNEMRLTNPYVFAHTGCVKIMVRPRPSMQSGIERGFVVFGHFCAPEMPRIVRYVGASISVDTSRARSFFAPPLSNRLNYGGVPMADLPTSQAPTDLLETNICRMWMLRDFLNGIDHEQFQFSESGNCGLIQLMDQTIEEMELAMEQVCELWRNNKKEVANG